MDRFVTHPWSVVEERGSRECVAEGGAMSMRQCDGVLWLRSRMQDAKSFYVVRERAGGIGKLLHVIDELV